MATEISLSKRLEVVKLYFEGLSYDEIVKRTGVAKGRISYHSSLGTFSNSPESVKP